MVTWLGRSITSIPERIVAILRGFALEVVAVVAGSARAVLGLLPGGTRVATTGRVLRERAVAARVKAAPRDADLLDAPTVAQPRRRRERTEVEQRAWERRRALLRRRLRIVLAVALLVSLLLAWIYVPASDAFRIRHVEVTGASSVGDLEARMLVDELLRDETVFTVDDDAVVDRLRQLPFVRSASVERHLPGGLELHVVEYSPLALAYGDGHYWLVARDGRILTKASKQEWSGRVPTVTLRQKDVKAGMRVADEPALRVLTAREPGSTLILESVSEDEYRITGTLEGGVQVRFGGPGELKQKVLAAELMLQQARKEDLDLVYIDVSVPSRPALCSRSDAGCLMPREGRDEGDQKADADGAPTTPEELGGDEHRADEDAGDDQAA
jgi:cell division septal protein FtsQ